VLWFYVKNQEISYLFPKSNLPAIFNEIRIKFAMLDVKRRTRQSGNLEFRIENAELSMDSRQRLPVIIFKEVDKRRDFNRFLDSLRSLGMTAFKENLELRI
jgi:hypothetical protein